MLSNVKEMITRGLCDLSDTFACKSYTKQRATFDEWYSGISAYEIHHKLQVSFQKIQYLQKFHFKSYFCFDNEQNSWLHVLLINQRHTFREIQGLFRGSLYV